MNGSAGSRPRKNRKRETKELHGAVPISETASADRVAGLDVRTASVCPLLVDSSAGPSSRFCRTSSRKTNSHFSGSTLGYGRRRATSVANGFRHRDVCFTRVHQRRVTTMTLATSCRSPCLNGRARLHGPEPRCMMVSIPAELRRILDEVCQIWCSRA